MVQDLVSIVNKKVSKYDYIPYNDVIYGDSGCTRLMYAVHCRASANKVKELIEQYRSSLWARTSSGMTVVHVFVKSYMNEYIRMPETDRKNVLNTLALFAEESGLIDSTDNQGNTPLSLCFKDVPVAIDLIYAFVELGANINAANKNGITLLHSIFTENVNLFKIHHAAIDNGANVNATTTDGNTPLTLIAKGYFTDYFIKATEYLVSKGANINHRNKNGETALHIYVKEYGDKHGVVDKLVKLGADTSIVANDGYSVDLLLMPTHKRLYKWLKSYIVSEGESIIRV